MSRNPGKAEKSAHSGESPRETKVKTLRDFSTGSVGSGTSRTGTGTRREFGLKHTSSKTPKEPRKVSSAAEQPPEHYGNSVKVTKANLPEFILTLIARGSYPKKIARQLSVRYKTVLDACKVLEAKEAIKLSCRSSATLYVITPFGESILANRSGAPLLGTRGTLGKTFTSSGVSSDGTNKIRTHNYGFKFRIIRDNPQADFTKESGYHEEPEGNGAWFAKYFTIRRPVRMTVKVTTQSVCIYFHEFFAGRKEFMKKLEDYSWRGAHSVFYKMRQHRIIVDEIERKVIRCHIANETPELNDVVDSKAHASVSLGRKASVLGVKADFEAKAWIDRSKGPVDVETNDLPYEENLIFMPERVLRMESKVLPALGRDLQENVQQVSQLTGLVTQLAQETDKYAVNIEKHLKVLDSMDATMKAIRDSLQGKV